MLVRKEEFAELIAKRHSPLPRQEAVPTTTPHSTEISIARNVGGNSQEFPNECGPSGSFSLP